MSEEDKLVNINEKVIVLKGILQTFDNTYPSNGRIYSSSVFLNEIKRIRPKMRINKIKKLFPDNKL
jgi:hypothetical protein